MKHITHKAWDIIREDIAYCIWNELNMKRMVFKPEVRGELRGNLWVNIRNKTFFMILSPEDWDEIY